jgi:hypothetical protein
MATVFNVQVYRIEVLHFSLPETANQIPAKRARSLPSFHGTSLAVAIWPVRWRCIHGAGSFDLFESQPIVSVSWKAKYHPRQMFD